MSGNGKRARAVSAPFRHVMPVILSSSITVVAASLMTTRLSLDLEAGGASVADTRMVVTAYPLGFIVGCLTVRGFAERYGHGVSFLVLVAVSIVFALGFPVLQSHWAWFVLRLAGGFAMAAIFIIAESWINLDSGTGNRGALFSYYMILNTLGSAAGPALVALPVASGAGAYVLAALIFALSTVPLIVSGRMRPAGVVRDGQPVAGRPMKLMMLMAVAPAIFVAGLQTGMTNMPFGVMAPIYATRLGYSQAEAGTLVSVFALGGLLAQWPVGWLSDRMPRHRLLAAASFAAALCCATIAVLAPLPAPVLFGLTLAFGFAALSIYPIAVAYAGAALDSEYLVALSSRLLLLHGFGAIIAPALSNELMARFGPSMLFVMLGAATLTLSVVAMLTTPVQRHKELRP